MGKKTTENKKEKWKQVLQITKTPFTRRWCNMKVGGTKTKCRAKVKSKEVACKETSFIINLVIAKIVS